MPVLLFIFGAALGIGLTARFGLLGALLIVGTAIYYTEIPR
jgi:hypothetical protein